MLRGSESPAVETLGPPVSLPTFSGPLDLLLHLIKKNELSIYDIPIFDICDQYHDHLRAMQELDLEVAGEFLWMASWLLQLKSRMLLPRPDDHEDPRDELVERLLEYRRVKELAATLYDRHVVRRCLWPSAVDTGAQSEESTVEWEDVDLGVLAHAYLEAMERFATAHPPPLTVLPLRFKVEDTMTQLYERVLDDGLLPLMRHLHSRSDAEEVVVVFVAALELVRLGGVLVEQLLPFAEIYLRPSRTRLDPRRFFAQGEADGA